MYTRLRLYRMTVVICTIAVFEKEKPSFCGEVKDKILQMVKTVVE